MLLRRIFITKGVGPVIDHQPRRIQERIHFNEFLPDELKFTDQPNKAILFLANSRASA
jgi:hypothetical protein